MDLIQQVWTSSCTSNKPPETWMLLRLSHWEEQVWGKDPAREINTQSSFKHLFKTSIPLNLVSFPLTLDRVFVLLFQTADYLAGPSSLTPFQQYTSLIFAANIPITFILVILSWSYLPLMTRSISCNSLFNYVTLGILHLFSNLVDLLLLMSYMFISRFSYSFNISALV